MWIIKWQISEYGNLAKIDASLYKVDVFFRILEKLKVYFEMEVKYFRAIILYDCYSSLTCNKSFTSLQNVFLGVAPSHTTILVVLENSNGK